MNSRMTSRTSRCRRVRAIADLPARRLGECGTKLNRKLPPRLLYILTFAMRLLPLLLAAAGAGLAAAQNFEPPTPEELAARERVRPAVEAIFRDARMPPERNADPRPRFFFEITDALVDLGPDVVPFLV